MKNVKSTGKDIGKTRNTENPPVDNPFLDVTDMVLSNEYTGLMYSPPKDDDELEAYSKMLNPE